MNEIANRRRLVLFAVIGLALAFILPELGLPKLLFADTFVGARIGRELVWITFGVLVNQGLWHRFVVVKGNQFIGKKTAFRRALGRAGQRAIDRLACIAMATTFHLCSEFGTK